MSYDVLDAIDALCPGVVPVRAMTAALAAAYPPSGAAPNAAQVQAVVLPLMPDGNPPQYTAGAPADPPLPMPGATPVFAAALPPYPTGLPLFQDSNPDPIDGWSIELGEDGSTGAPL
jgi:hypothetical protein